HVDQRCGHVRSQTILQLFRSVEVYFEDILLADALTDVFIAVTYLVGQGHLQRLGTEPDLACGHLVDIEDRPITGHELLEQPMDVLQILLEFLPALLGVFTEQGQGTLVLPGGEHLVVHIMLLQHAVEVRQLCHYANRAKHGEGRRQYPVGDTGHHVATAGRDLVDAYRQGHAGVTHTGELRGGQPVGVDHAATAFQAHHHLVTWRG